VTHFSGKNLPAYMHQPQPPHRSTSQMQDLKIAMIYHFHARGRGFTETTVDALCQDTLIKHCWK